VLSTLKTTGARCINEYCLWECPPNGRSPVTFGVLMSSRHIHNKRIPRVVARKKIMAGAMSMVKFSS